MMKKAASDTMALNAKCANQKADQAKARVNKVVNQIAMSDEHLQPTKMDKVLAMQAYSDMKKRTNKNYVERLRQQLAQAEAAKNT